MKKGIITAIIVFSTLVGNYAAAETWIDDPSAVALPEVKGEDWRNTGRYRILGDFNGDGIEDMALSFERGLFGNGGGEFTVYLRNAEGKYREFGKIWAHPAADAIAIEKWGKEIRIWTYAHGGGGIGRLGYYEVTEKGLSDFQGITIHPSDSGTEMGDAIYDAVFKHSAVKFRLEQSTTINGKVEWK